METRTLLTALFLLLAGNYVWLHDIQSQLLDWRLEMDGRVDAVESADDNHERETIILCEWIRELHAYPIFRCPRLRRFDSKDLQVD